MLCMGRHRAYEAAHSGIAEGLHISLLGWVPPASPAGTFAASRAYQPKTLAQEYKSADVRKMKLIAAKDGELRRPGRTYDSGVHMDFMVRCQCPH